jgi:hypothetical protein
MMSEEKKVSGGKFLLYPIQYLFTLHSPSTIFNQTRINPNNKTHTSISHLLNQILIDGVEEVSLVRPKNLITQHATTNYSALFFSD